MSGCFLCSPNASRTSRRAKVSRPEMMWYGFPLFMPLRLLWYCVACFALLSSLITVCLSPFFLLFFRWRCPLLWPVEFWRKKRLQPFLLHFPVWRRSPLVVAWLRRLGNRCRVSKLLRIPKLPSSLHLKVLSLSELPVPSEPCFLRHCQVKRLWEARLYPNKQVNRISLYNSVLSLLFSPLFSPLPLFFLSFFFPFSF